MVDNSTAERAGSGDEGGSRKLAPWAGGDDALRQWLRIAGDRLIVRRAAATSVIVGALLTAVNHGPRLLRGDVDPALAWQVALTFAVPFVVSTVASVAAIRSQRADRTAVLELLEGEIEAINKFPGQNPNPVMRMGRDGRLLYANDASEPISTALGLTVGELVPAGLRDDLWEAGQAQPARQLEVVSGWRTFSVLPVPVPELEVLNLYGTDVTAAKVVERFPDSNPNPVLRTAEDWRLIYANPASTALVEGLGLRIGDRLPDDLAARLSAGLSTDGRASADPREVRASDRTFALTPVAIPEFGFTNIYGTDVTALKALDKFPDQNPNPVLRASPDGRLVYANPASADVVAALGVGVGEPLPDGFWSRVSEAVAGTSARVIEIEGHGRLFELLVVAVYEFGFINLYGTDVTAARQVERANRENERLLLNILPAPIADRLRQGEMVIADRFEEMTVLFADVVGFTGLSTRMSPAGVVELLNRVFSVFDELADRHDLEKIKTIGDAYMVVGGLTPGRGHDVERVADMGLDMIEHVAAMEPSLGHPLEIRVGMQTGPAVAGVIGLKKFIYDVWGDTVNTASRMESHGVPGRIHVTEATYRHLEGAYDFESRGIIDIRGKGPMHTYLMVGRSARGSKGHDSTASGH